MQRLPDTQRGASDLLFMFENASKDRTDLRVKDRLTETYGDFEGPEIGVERGARVVDDAAGGVGKRRKAGMLRMHRPNIGKRREREGV